MRTILISVMLVLSNVIFAQIPKPEMADSFRADGKIYVVVAVVVLILIGLLAFIVLTDKKVKDLEGKIK